MQRCYPNGGTLTVEAKRRTKVLALVSDTDRQDEKTIEKVFDPFLL